MYRIFVTSIGGDIGSAVLRCVKDAFPYSYIVGCDIKKYNQGLEYVDSFYIAPPYENTKCYLDFIIKICILEKVKYFLPISEKEIVLTNNIKQDLKKMGIYVLINNSEILEVCSSKYNTAKVLSENGILSPKTFKLEEYNEEILSYPIVVKGDFSCGSHSLVIAYNKEELDKAVTVISDAILQEYIGSLNEEYTVGVFSDGKETRSIAFRRQLGYGGMSIYVELVNDVQISKIACKIANIFKLCGSINIQMRKQNDKYFIFEINPRLSSTVAFRYKLGFKDIIWWLQMLDEDSVISEYVSIRGDIIGVKKLDEIIFNKNKIFVGETGFNN